MSKNLAFITIFLILLSSCKNVNQDITEREGEPDVYNVEQSDSKMNAAILTARENFSEFKAALNSRDSNQTDFVIKQRFKTPTIDGEHIWISDIELIDHKFIGYIGNEPVHTRLVKIGDRVEVDTLEMSDWMYFDKGIVRGGYTIKVLRNDLSPEEKKEFDFETGLKFSD